MPRLTTDTFRDWLEPLIKVTEPKVVVGIGNVVEMTDRFVLIQDTGIGNDMMQGLFERRVYRIQARGRASSLQDAEKLANVIYEALHELENFDIGEIRVLAIRCTAKPRQMTYTDRDGRFMFVAEYEVKSSQD